MSKIQKTWLQTKENKQVSFLTFPATISILAFQNGVLLFSMLQSDNSTLNFFICNRCTFGLFRVCTTFYKYAILRDRNTSQYDTNTIVNKYFIWLQAFCIITNDMSTMPVWYFCHAYKHYWLRNFVARNNTIQFVKFYPILCLHESLNSASKPN